MLDDTLDNLCLACPHGNLNKGPNLTTRDLETREIIPLFHPGEHVWDEHFRLEGAQLVGLTTIGTATARLLKMNAEDQLKIRAALGLRGAF